MTISEKYERADNELFHLNEAIEHLEEAGECEEVILIIRDKISEISAERNYYHGLIEAHDERDESEQKREYYSSVL